MKPSTIAYWLLLFVGVMIINMIVDAPFLSLKFFLIIVGCLIVQLSGYIRAYQNLRAFYMEHGFKE